MKTLIGHATFFALIVLILSPQSVVHAASSQPTGSVHFCLPFEPEHHPRPAAKRLADLQAGQPRTVRMIYFVPKNSPFIQASVNSMKASIKQIQAFFAAQMQANGYGKKTFSFETDESGEPLVHRVDGQYAVSNYGENGAPKVRDEIGQTFDLEANIYFISVDFRLTLKKEEWTESKWIGGMGFHRGKSGGYAMIHSTETPLASQVHEFGHAFGLKHDFSDRVNIMSYGRTHWGTVANGVTLAACHARLLAVHPYFKSSSSVSQSKQSPSIRFTSPLTYPAGAASVPIELEVGASKGLHQVLLQSKTRTGHISVGSYELVACRGWKAKKKKKAVVKFEYDGTIPSSSSASLSDTSEHAMQIKVVDKDGNITHREFVLEAEPAVVSTLTKVSGDGQVGQTGTTLSEPFVVSASDQNGTPFAGAVVRFSVTAGGGTLSDATASTGSNGRARSTLTLGSTPGPNTVEATVAGLDAVTFTATAREADTAPVVNEPVQTPVVNEPVQTPVVREPVQTPVVREPVQTPVVREPVQTPVVREPVQTPVVQQAVPYTLTKFSGDGQVGQADTTLSEPFVVSVSDQNGKLFVGAVVRFAVTAGGGTLSDTTDSTGSNGRAYSTLTLGRAPGPNTVVATVAGLDTVTFTATATATATALGTLPDRLAKVAGDGQAGLAGAQLAAPLVVSVLDEDDKPIAGAVVHFAITAGGGTLSDTTAFTDAHGRARTILTLGRNLGPNTVVATVADVDTVTFTATALGQIPRSLTDVDTVTFTATARGILPDRLAKVAGDGQAGLAGAQLAAPLVVSVLDEDDKPIAGAVVRFAVTAGGGTLSATHVLTDARGRVRTFLRLGPAPGTNTVAATVAELDTVLTFTATGQASKFAGFDDFFAHSKRVARPSRTELRQNAPNPFNSETVVSYFLLEPGPVRLEVFALSGQRVAVLSEGPQSAGYHRLHWDGHDDLRRPVASGVYFYRLVTADDVFTRKLVLLR